jgi:hypothetical protein
MKNKREPIFLNKKHEDIHFHSPTMGRLNFPAVAAEILRFVKEDPHAAYKIVVGTDSSGGTIVDVVSVITVHKVGRGGRYFWHKADKRIIFNLRDKIYQEVMTSLELAEILPKALREQIDLTNSGNITFEIHIDVGEVGATKDLVKEVVGIVRGSGFEAVTKPFSYCASSVADKYT